MAHLWGCLGWRTGRGAWLGELTVGDTGGARLCSPCHLGITVLLRAALPSPVGLREGHFIPLAVAPPPPLSLQLAGATWKLVAALTREVCPSQERT